MRECFRQKLKLGIDDKYLHRKRMAFIKPFILRASTKLNIFKKDAMERKAVIRKQRINDFYTNYPKFSTILIFLNRIIPTMIKFCPGVHLGIYVNKTDF